MLSHHHGSLDSNNNNNNNGHDDDEDNDIPVEDHTDDVSTPPSGCTTTHLNGPPPPLVHQQQEHGDGSAADHHRTLMSMRRQFAVLERAFLTLEGLCRTELNSIAEEQKVLALNESRSMHRFQQHAAHHGAGIVKLNVGGVRFHVSQTTLLKFRGSLFDVLLSSQFPVERDEKGYVFVDRDPELFREVLYFLRTGDSSTIRMLPQISRRRVIDEAKYFGIDQLVMELRSTRLEWVCETACRSVNGDIPAPRCFAAAQYIGNGVIYLFGGCTANDTFFDSLYRIQVVGDVYSDGVADSFSELDQRSGGGAVGAQSLHTGSPGGVAGGYHGGAPYVPASYSGAGGGTTSQSLYLANASAAGSGGGTDEFTNNGGNYETAGGAAAALGNGNSGFMASTSAQPRPERFEFSLVRPRGELCPPARSGHALVYINGSLLLLYGNDKSGHVHDVFAFNTYSQSWTILTALGDYVEPRSGHSVTVVGDRLWLIGGKQIFPTMKTFGDIMEGTVDLEQETVTWKMVSPNVIVQGNAVVASSPGGFESGVLERRAYHSAAAYGENKIIIHGGIVRDVYCHDLCVYDTVQNTWHALQPGDPPGYTPSLPRSGHMAIVHKDEMFVFGSYSEDHPQMLLYSLCLHTFQWKRVAASGKGPARRAAPSGVLLPQDASTVLLPRLLIFGGFDISSRKCFNDVFTLTL